MTDWMDNFLCGEFLGLPLAQTPAGSDDCLRHDYHVRIGGKWHEIITEGLRWSDKEAYESLSRIFNRLAKEAHE
jgi:hypothetical protein